MVIYEERVEVTKYMIALLGTCTTLVTVSHVTTFLKVFKSLLESRYNSSYTMQEAISIMPVFHIIFFNFNGGFFPLMVSFASKNKYEMDLKSQIIFLLFMSTTLFNPLLTLCVKPQFGRRRAISRDGN